MQTGTFFASSVKKSKAGVPRPRWFLWAVVALATVLVVDRLLRWQAIARVSEQPVPLLPGVRLSFLLNPGIAFSLPVPSWLFVLFTGAVFVLLVVWFLRSIQIRAWTAIFPLAMVLSGSLSNLADRLLYRGVVDYLELPFGSVINVADVVILVGIALLAFSIVKPGRREDSTRERGGGGKG